MLTVVKTVQFMTTSCPKGCRDDSTAYPRGGMEGCPAPGSNRARGLSLSHSVSPEENTNGCYLEVVRRSTRGATTVCFTTSTRGSSSGGRDSRGINGKNPRSFSLGGCLLSLPGGESGSFCVVHQYIRFTTLYLSAAWQGQTCARLLALTDEHR